MVVIVYAMVVVAQDHVNAAGSTCYAFQHKTHYDFDLDPDASVFDDSLRSNSLS